MLRDLSKGALRCAAALLAVGLAAAACDEDGGPSIASVCHAYCDQLAECTPDEFDAEYDSASDCEDQCKDGAEDYFDTYEPQECKDEELAVAECSMNLSCADLEEGDYSDCYGEYAELDDCLEANGGCSQDAATACYDASFTCTDNCDTSSDTYAECVQACLDAYCTCIETVGCDPVEYGCEG